VIGFTNCIGMQVLFANGREKILLLSMATAALVDVGLNFLLIPRLGAAGAAIATLTAETSVLAVQVALAWKPYSLRALFDLRIASYFAAGGAMAIPSLLGVPEPGQPFLRLIILAVPGCAIYAGCLFVLGDPLIREILKAVRPRPSAKT
jgi:O-antigen/teichoic acid export membrane protein